MDKKLRRCETCEYFEVYRHVIQEPTWNDYDGWCKFNPKTLSKFKDDWCGRWKFEEFKKKGK